MIYFCLILNWKHFTCSLFLPHEIWSYRCRHISMKVSMATVPAITTPPNYHLLMITARQKRTPAQTLYLRINIKDQRLFSYIILSSQIFSRERVARMRGKKKQYLWGREKENLLSLHYLFRNCHLRALTATPSLTSFTRSVSFSSSLSFFLCP